MGIEGLNEKTEMDTAAVKYDKKEHHETAKHCMMSLSDITEKLHNDFQDEIDDANKYQDMANSAAKMGHCELADILCAMAKDEHSHAKFIHEFLKESGVTVCEKTCHDWEELENRFHGILCQEEY